MRFQEGQHDAEAHGSEEIFGTFVQLCRVRAIASGLNSPLHSFPGVGAAPHLPAGILSPYSNGERGTLIAGFANRQRRKKGAEAAASPFSPSLYGEKCPGRAMRGGADFDSW